MAKRSTPQSKRAADIRAADIPGAIAKLERRLRDFEEARPDTYAGDLHDLSHSLCAKLDGTLIGVFGAGTLDYDRVHISTMSFAVNRVIYDGPVSRHERVGAFKAGQASAKMRIQTAIDQLSERLQPAAAIGGGARALRAYEGLDLHPEIERAAGDLYRDGYYAKAIVDAVIALNDSVRMRSGLAEDGSTLMQRAFGGADAVLRFNDLAHQSDIDEQKGFMMMFSGAVAGLRNPRAHKLIQDDPERALEFIAFVSLLAKLVDGAKKRQPAEAAP